MNLVNSTWPSYQKTREIPSVTLQLNLFNVKTEGGLFRAYETYTHYRIFGLK